MMPRICGGAPWKAVPTQPGGTWVTHRSRTKAGIRGAPKSPHAKPGCGAPSMVMSDRKGPPCAKPAKEGHPQDHGRQKYRNLIRVGDVPLCQEGEGTHYHWGKLRRDAQFMTQIGNQLKQVFRRLGRAPMFTAITVFTLAAGIGANTAVFSVLEGALLKPLPYPQSDRLVGVWLTAPGIQIKALNLSPSDYFIFREQNKSFQDVGLYAGDSGTVTGLAEPEQVPELLVTDGTLSILGVQPMLGRGFRKEDDTPGAPDTVLLG